MPNDCKPKRRNDIEALIARAGGDDHIRREFVGMTGDIGGPGNNIDSRRATGQPPGERSEEHTSELQSLMRISYAVFCLKKKKKTRKKQHSESDKTQKNEI